jgi:hypothetical protein
LNKKKYNPSPRGPFIVEGKEYKSISELADEYNLNRNAIYKRFSRGKTDDDLIPPKHRKSDVEPEKKINYKFYVDGKGFKSEVEACNFFGVKFVTYRSRKYKGYSIEECLGITENSNLGGKRFTSNQHFHKSKEVIVNGEKYKSRADAARAFGKTPEQVRSLLDKGRTLEEALGLEIADLRYTITYEGIKYRSLKELCEEKDLKITTIQSRINRGMTLDDSILEGDYIENEGRYNLTILKRDKELSNSMGYLYFIRLNLNDEWKHKIGITAKSTEQRMKGIKYELLFEVSSTLINCYKFEQVLLKKYKHKRDLRKGGQDLDGFTEVLNLDTNEEKEIITTMQNFDL